MRADETVAGRPTRNAGLLACVVATIAFSVYAQTLLPGVDLGDTGGFQAAVLWPETSARQAYPLYYGLARPFVLAVSPDNPARGLNLFSALSGSVAVGLLTYVAATVTGSAAAGLLAGLLLAFSHTFWTQSIIAEVYALHLASIGCCLHALRAWQQKPTQARLAVFLAIYAVSFGNHLSMILLLFPFALFLFAAHPRPRELLRLRTVGLAAGIAVAATLLYAPNFLFVWTNVDAPSRGMDRVATFWFDVTKADWRGTMMLGIDGSELPERLAMWMWDARVQFGIAGLAAAVAGLVRLWIMARAWTLLLLTAYAINTVFAVTYNVGDPHVFFLPGHLFTALAISGVFAGWRLLGARPADDTGIRRAWRSGVPAGATHAALVALVALIAYAGWRAWDTWPSATRSDDRRANVLVARAAAGLADTNAILLSDMDWQSENALLYSARYERPTLAWRRIAEVLPHLPFLVRDNQTIGRDVVLVGNAAARVAAAYGPLFPLAPDGAPPATLAERAENLPRGTPFVLTLLEPTPEERLDAEDFERALTALAGRDAARPSRSRFQVWAGMTGEPGGYYRASDRPFRDGFSVLGDNFSVRMESWLPFDTFRRGGFGRVLRDRDPVLTIERGVSLVWFGLDGSPAIAYAAGLYAPRPRIRIPAAVPQQLARSAGAILDTAPVSDGPTNGS